MPLEFCTRHKYNYIVGYEKREVITMSPRTGRPTSDPKDKFLKIRVSQNDLDKLKEVSDKKGISKTEVIRIGINIQFEELKGK